MSSIIRGDDNFDSAYGAALKAWVNFNGTGTVAINASLNVTSVTDTGTGLYTINFTNALADTNYAVMGGLVTGPETAQQVVTLYAATGGSAPNLKSTTQVRIVVHTTVGFDPYEVSIAALR